MLELVDEMGDLFFHGSGGGGISSGSSDSNSSSKEGRRWTTLGMCTGGGKVSSYREEAGEGTHRSIDMSRGTK